MPKWIFDLEVESLERKKIGKEKIVFAEAARCLDPDYETHCNVRIPHNCLLGTKLKVTVETVENGEETVENAVSS